MLKQLMGVALATLLSFPTSVYAGASGPGNRTAPILKPWTMYRGEQTLAGAGAVPMATLMQIGGAPVTTWSIASGDDACTDINATTGAITGATSGCFGTSTRNLVIQAANAFGTVTAPLTIVGVANTYTVSTTTDVSSTGVNGLRNTTNKAALGGKTVAIAYGSNLTWNGNASYVSSGYELAFNGFNTHTGTFVISSEDITNPTTISKISMVGTERAAVRYLNFVMFISKGTEQRGSNPQAESMMEATYSATFLMSNTIEIDHNTFGAPASTDVSQWMRALYIHGNANSPYDQVTAVNVHDNVITRVFAAIAFKNTATSQFNDNIIDSYSGDAVDLFGRQDDMTVSRNILVRPYQNYVDPNTHSDSIQVGGPEATGVICCDYTNITIEKNVLSIANGDEYTHAIPYADDVAVYSGLATGKFLNNMTLKNNVSDSPTFQGLKVEGGSGLDAQFNTSTLGNRWSIFPTGTPQAQGPITSVAVTGTFAKNFVMQVASTITTPFPTVATTNVVATTTCSIPGTWDEATRVACLAPYFVNPGATIDYANMTASQIATAVKAAYAAKRGGPLDKGSNIFWGAVCPDGTTWVSASACP